MATENGVGVQTRAMTEAQCMEDGAQRQLGINPEWVQGTNPVAATGQGTTDPDTQNPVMNSTVDKTDDELIEEFIRRQGAIGLDWYVPNFSNTQVGELIKDRLPIETARGRILFNCPPTQRILLHSNFWVGPHNRPSVHIPNFPRGHSNTMPAGGVWSKPPSRKTREWPRFQWTLDGRARKNPTDQKDSSTSRCHGVGGNRGQDTPVLQAVDTLCKNFSRAKEKSQTVTRGHSDSLQDVWVVHLRRFTTGWWGNEVVHHGKRTENY